MKEVINNALLAEDKFMPQVILRQLGFGSSVFKPFTERKEKIITKKKTGGSRNICQNGLDKAYFQYRIS